MPLNESIESEIQIRDPSCRLQLTAALSHIVTSISPVLSLITASVIIFYLVLCFFVSMTGFWSESILTTNQDYNFCFFN